MESRLIAIVVLIFSAIIHEIMHGFVAYRLGDPTAKDAGRLTLNPIPHIDPFSSILLPALLIFVGSPVIFGAAKPVPINPIYFKDGKKDLALVGLAGPLTNIGIAILFSFLFKIFMISSPALATIFYAIVFYNLILGIINLIPIPPLDGSRVFSAVLPDSLIAAYYSIESIGIFILFFLLLFPIGGFNLGNLIEKLLFFSLKFLGM